MKFIYGKHLSGVQASVVASVALAVVAALIYQSRTIDGTYSIFIGSGVRIAVNIALILFLLCRESQFSSRHVWGRSVGLLSLWGMMGAGTIITFFVSVCLIGIAKATLLQTSQSIFIALLAAVFLKQKNDILTWVVIMIAIIGIALVVEARLFGLFSVGAMAALASGLFAAFAYIVLARLNKRESALTISFYWCFVGMLAHFLLAAFTQIDWPTDLSVWLLLIIAAVVASIAQLYFTHAYQSTSVVVVSVISFLTPVFGFFIDIVIFNQSISFWSMIGALLVIGSGLVLPISRTQKRLNV